jgi:hypothetical protein
MAERIFVAVAWPYTNGPRHLGHVAGFGVPSDVFARYHRLAGNDVLMVGGTDEHGTHAAGSLHRGHVPDLRVSERARRSMRQLREPAGSRSAHRPALEDRRVEADLQTDRAFLPRPSGLHRAAHQMDLEAIALAAERSELLAQLHREPEAARDHPRYRLGRADPLARLAGSAR